MKRNQLYRGKICNPSFFLCLDCTDWCFFFNSPSYIMKPGYVNTQSKQVD